MKKILFLVFISFNLFLYSCNKENIITNKEYEVSFETNSNIELDSIFSSNDGKLIKIDDPKRTGYDFLGWYLDFELTIPFSFDTIINRDIKLYAKWELSKIKVTIYDNDEIYKVLNYRYGEKLDRIDKITSIGYEFVGLYYEKDFINKYDSNIDIVLTTDLNFYIKWDIEKLTINTYIDGKLDQSYSELYNTFLSSITKPTKENYDFDGWYIDNTYKTKIDENTLLKKDYNLYGRFILKQFDVLFYDGDNQIKKLTVDYDTIIDNKSFNETKTGYHLEGLYLDKEYKIPLETLHIKGTTNIYTKWEINTYDIIWKIDGVLYKSSKINHFQGFSEEIEPTKENYDFDGWYLDDNYKTKLTTDYIITNDITLYARFILKKFNINVYDNDKIIKNLKLEYGKMLKEILPITKTGYTLINYYQDKDCKKELSLNTQITTNINIYTLWQINTYEIKIINENIENKINKNYGDLILKDIKTPTKEGYIFDGWYKDKNFNKAYTNTDKVTSNHTLYAKWINENNIPYKIIYKEENINNTNYTILKEEIKYGKLNEIITIIPQPYQGFTPLNDTYQETITYPNILTIEIKYQRNILTITYVGPKNNTQTETKKYGSNFKINENIKYDGYIIDGWYKEDTYQTNVISINNLTTNITIYAKITVITYGTAGLEYTINSDNKSYSITGYNGIDIDVIIPNGYNHLPVTKIIYLSENKNIKTITIANNIETISNKAFINLISLEQIILPNTLLTIGDFAFANCKNLKQIYIPEYVKTIGIATFYNNLSLIEIVVNINNQNYKSVDGVLINKQTKELILYPSGKQNKNYQIPENIISISRAAFMNNQYLKELITLDTLEVINSENFINFTSLEKITIGKNVKYISDYNFEDTKKLKEINVNTNNLYYTSEDGILFNKNLTILIKYPSSKENNLYITKNTVLLIKTNAFENLKYLKDIIISESTKYIENDAFINNQNLNIYLNKPNTYPYYKLSSLENNIYYLGEWTLNNNKPEARNE